MKPIAIIAILSTIAVCCKDPHSSWKQAENTDYNKDSIIYESDKIYLFKRGPSVIVTFETLEYDTSNIRKSIPGITKLSRHKAWIDTCCYDLETIRHYFDEFTNQRMR